MLQTAIPTLHATPATRPPMVTIRCAKQRDLPELRDMITELSAHHGDAAPITPEQLERDLFGRTPWITALVAEAGNRLIGYAILVPIYRAAEGARGMELHHPSFARKAAAPALAATWSPRRVSRRRWPAATSFRSAPPRATSRHTISTNPNASSLAR